MRERLGCGLGVALALAGCVTRSGVLNARPDSGTSVTYAVSLHEARKAARDVLAKSYFKVKDKDDRERDPKSWLLLGYQGVSVSGTGRYARIILEESEGGVVVWVYVISKFDTEEDKMTDLALTKEIHAGISARLGK